VIHGGGQERGFRSGTLNVPGIVGLAEACRIAKNEMHKQNDKFRFLTRQIVDELLKRRDDISINGHLQKRLPHTINLEIPNVDNKWLSMKMKEFCFSTGSACSNIKDEPSHVLLALGLNEKRTQNCVRIGVGPNTTEKEVSLFLEELKKVI
jgi:cysteine desulfurase